MRLLAGLGLALFAGTLSAEAPTPERVMALCTGAEGPAHCGRLVEAEQLKALPNLATREGDTLKVTLFPSGQRLFVDSVELRTETSYALWDYWSPINAVVLLVTSGDDLRYAILQRVTGNVTMLPAEPVLAPDRQRVVVADFCGSNCANEISVWRVARDSVKKELGYRPNGVWSDVTVTWKDPETVAVRFTPPGGSARTQERKLSAADWQRF